MRITRLGIKATVFYTMLVFAFFAAPYLNLFFMLLAFCTVLCVLNIWWSYRNIAGISGSIEEFAPMPAGASQMTKSVLRCSHRVRHDLAIEIVIDGKSSNMIDTVEISPGTDQTVDVMLPAMSRGVHRVDQLRIRSIYPFGTVAAHRSLAGPETVMVYPAPADLAKFRDRSDVSSHGLGGAETTEMGPAGLREFRDGDELRAVHWKASARRRELVVKELEGDASPGMEVLLDLRHRDQDLEDALSLVSGLALECKSNKELFTLHTQDHRGTYGKGHGSFAKLLAYLAAVQPLPDDAPAPPSVSQSVLRLPLPKHHVGAGVHGSSEATGPTPGDSAAEGQRGARC